MAEALFFTDAFSMELSFGGNQALEVLFMNSYFYSFSSGTFLFMYMVSWSRALEEKRVG